MQSIIAKYNVLLKKMIPEMNTMTKHNEYLLMQDGPRSHTAKLTLEMLKDKKQLQLLEPHNWSPYSPDLNPVDLGSRDTGSKVCIPRPTDNQSRFFERSHYGGAK